MSMLLKVLIIEDNQNDIILLLRELKKGDYEPSYEVAEDAPAMQAALQKQSWDIILCDFRLPQFDGLEALEILRRSGLDLPFIIVSGQIGEDTAVEVMKAGAHDVILKSNLQRLTPAIARALNDAANRHERRKAEEALNWSNAKFQLLSDTASLLLSSRSLTTIQSTCERIMDFLDCDVFFNYLIDSDRKRLRLNAYAGLAPEAARKIEWLEYGDTVCGCAAGEACPLIDDDLQLRPGNRTIALVRSLGIQSYACHPIRSIQGITGNLSFGSRKRTRFTSEELELMKAVTNQVAIALERRHYEEQLENYARRITQVQEEERKRVARELHDEAAQSMSILSLEMDALISRDGLGSEKSLEKLRSIKANFDATMQNIRRYSHELHSSLLDHLGLTAALEQLVEETKEMADLSAELEIQGDERKLSEEADLALFRIAQQALRNIRQHARATEAHVILEYLPDRVCLTITDNGRGFDPDAESETAVKRGSLGLVSMKERAHLIGAELKIESGQDAGTSVLVELEV